MDLKEYLELASATRKNLGTQRDNLLHMVLGMVTEAAEIANVFKAEMVYERDIDLTNVKEELGDLFWFFINMVDLCGFDLERDILVPNIAKLRTRYRNAQYSNKQGNVRDLEAEREALESGNVPLP